MTYARLAYRPNSYDELRLLLRYLRKQELKKQYAANTVCLILNALRPQLDRAIYSDFVEALDLPQHGQDSRTGEQIVEDLVTQLQSRRAARQKESDDRERKKVYDWLMGGDTENGSIHA